MFFSTSTSLLLLLSATPLCWSKKTHSPSTQPEPCSQIFILGENEMGTASMSKALKLLGYTHVPFQDLNTTTASFHSLEGAADFRGLDTFTTLQSSEEYAKVSSQHPKAKFILPLETKEDFSSQGSRPQPCTRSWLGLLDLLSPKNSPECSEESRDTLPSRATVHHGNMLKMVVREPEHVIGEKWSELCKFLGLGYSFVERLKLRGFPSV